MPPRPKKPCSHPGCAKLTEHKFCPDHVKAEQWRNDRQRGTAAQRGYGSQWRKIRDAFLADHPLCSECEQRGRVTVAQVVHHIDENQLNNSPDNLQAMCRPCHERNHGRVR